MILIEIKNKNIYKFHIEKNIINCYYNFQKNVFILIYNKISYSMYQFNINILNKIKSQ